MRHEPNIHHFLFSFCRIIQARAKAIQEQNVELLTSGALDDPMGGKRATKWRTPKKPNERKAKFDELYKSLETELTPGESANGSTTTTAAAAASSPDENVETQIVPHTNVGALAPIAPSWEQAYPKSKFGKAIILPDHATAEERQASTMPVEAKLNFSEWKDNLPESISDDLDGIFRSEEEVAQKEAIFNSLNKNYLEQEERKETARLSAEAATKDQEYDEVAQAEGHARYLKTNRGRKRRRGGGGDAEEGEGDEPTTEEALLAALAKRKISRKINYDAMSAIFDEDGSFSTDHMEDGASTTDMDPVFAML
jgi:transcription factor IIIB subunit 2